MDHLPYPKLNVPPIVVPYLAGFEYDGEDFATFPERVGYWKDGTLDLDRPCRKLAALAQAWLFFGLIDVFTGQCVDKGLLIWRENNNRADKGVVDTTALGGIVEKSVKRSQMHFPDYTVLKRARARLIAAAKASSTLDRIQADDASSSAVFLSIKALIIYLSEMFETAFSFEIELFVRPIPKRSTFRCEILKMKRPDGSLPAPARLLMDRMRQSGWCIHQIVEIFRKHDYCTVYYYSSIARAESWDDITHEACTEEQCIAYNIKDNSCYRYRHTEECSERDCDFIGPPEDKVADVIRAGDIPLVGLNSATLENQTQLEVRSATLDSRYTAISHVWIDGHGNPTASALPRCQLRKLAARLSAISSSAAQQSWRNRLWKRLQNTTPISHLVWIDTLCIPPQRDLEDRKFLRKKAIHRMALIYAGAKQVLVLDAELEKLSYEDSPRELANALISCSRWNSRCWTLEEGALARKCLFQFKDAARDATEYKGRTPPVILSLFESPLRAVVACIWYTIHIYYKWSEWPLRKISPDFAHNYIRRELAYAAQESVQMDIQHSWHASEREAPSRDEQVLKFLRTWNDVGCRSTTRPEDIHPIIANLTDFSAAQIMALETPVLRTKMIVHCIGVFPLDLLWTPCARLQASEDTADRWIPSTPGPEPLVEQVKLRFSDKGLVVDSENRWKDPETFWIPHGMVAPRFCFRRSRDNHGELWYVVKCIIAEGDALVRSASETACLILSPDAASADATIAPQVLRGARLLVTQGDSEMSESLYLRYDCPIVCIIQTYQPDVDQIPDTPIMTVSKVSESQELVIESTFDPKDREKFVMRSRDFYYGLGKSFASQLIIFSSSLPGVVLIDLAGPKF